MFILAAIAILQRLWRLCVVRIDVAFIPQLAPPEAAASSVCVVIDVLRATTTLTTIVACGAALVAVAADVTAARALKAADREAILMGEIGGLRPSDFDLGNSPREISPQVIGGRRAICHTSNGTAAIRAVATAPIVLLGCLRNSAAVARAAFVHAQEGERSILIVCSGGAGGRAFALDDALAAGQIVAALAEEAAVAGLPTELSDAAIASRTLRQSALAGVEGIAGVEEPAHTRWEQVLRRTSAGQHLTQIGLGDDIPFCAEIDRETTVPLVRSSEGAVLVGVATPLLAVGRA
jgi:2-phosphosulfolactate phosphatase